MIKIYMEITLENRYIKAAFSPVGAEMISFFDKTKNIELLWQGEKGVYTDRSPNLFPMIGRLKNGKYTYDGKEYRLCLHGFAKDSLFTPIEQTSDSVTFLLTDSPGTLEVYPFKFNFLVKYELKENKLITSYTVKNTGRDTMYFGVGGHPAFNLPCSEEASGVKIEGSKLVFEHEENPDRLLFDPDEILITGAERYGPVTEIPLSKDLFAVDALLFKNLKGKSVALQRADGISVKFRYNDCPYLAFWTHKNGGSFICFEPWCGLPDSFEPISELKDKEGINRLGQGCSFHYNYETETCA